MHTTILHVQYCWIWCKGFLIKQPPLKYFCQPYLSWLRWFRKITQLFLHRNLLCHISYKIIAKHRECQLWLSKYLIYHKSRSICLSLASTLSTYRMKVHTSMKLYGNIIFPLCLPKVECILCRLSALCRSSFLFNKHNAFQ